MLPQRLSAALTLGCLLLATAPLANARDKIDLNRITPVPAGEPIPVADFCRPSLFANPHLNPAGTHIAALISAGEDRQSLVVYDLDRRKKETVNGADQDQDIYSPVWLNNQRIVFSVGGARYVGSALLAGDIGRLADSYALIQVGVVRMVSVPDKNPLQPLYWLQRTFPDAKDGGVIAINSSLNLGPLKNLRLAETGRSDLLNRRDQDARHFQASYPIPTGGMGTGYLADKDGELAFAFTEQDGIATLHRYVDGAWVKCPVNLDEVAIVGCGDKPGELVVRGPRQPGRPRALQIMDAATGQLGAVLLETHGYDFTGSLRRHPVTHVIVGLHYLTTGPQTVWFNKGDQKTQRTLEDFFPGKVVQIIDRNKAETRFLVAVSTDRQPATFFWVDFSKHTVGQLDNSAPWLDPARMRPMKAIKFKTRDDRELDAYVTLPAGASTEHPAPLVVLPHGGPWVRDAWGFDREVQFLASRGYAVLQPNYRGSSGYDWMFPEEDRYQFRKMSDDVTDATKTLLASGLVDPKRVAIMGASFGGYLAISGVVNEPDLYRCAVTIAGIFDWEQVLKERKYYQFDSPSYGWLKRKLGDPGKQPEFFDSISPVRHVDRIRVPVFVGHGKDDPVADVAESRRLISELEAHHIPHESLLVPEEGHGMHRLDDRVKLYTRIEAFLAKNLAPIPPAPPAAP